MLDAIKDIVQLVVGVAVMIAVAAALAFGVGVLAHWVIEWLLLGWRAL